MAQVIKRALIMKFYPASYTADVLILEATSTQLQGVPITTQADGTSAQPGALCALLLFDEQNLSDGCILAIYGNAPSQPPGRTVIVPGYQQFSNVAIAAGVTQTFSLAGGSSGIPVGALGVLFKAFYGSTVVGAYVNMAPHGGSIGNYVTIGNTQAASQSVNGNGVLPVDANGQIDVQANAGTCNVTLNTYGYVI